MEAWLQANYNKKPEEKPILPTDKKELAKIKTLLYSTWKTEYEGKDLSSFGTKKMIDLFWLAKYATTFQIEQSKNISLAIHHHFDYIGMEPAIRKPYQEILRQLAQLPTVMNLKEWEKLGIVSYSNPKGKGPKSEGLYD